MLVVSHEASRTGAPRVATQVVGALAASRCDCQVVLRWGGPLRQDFLSTGARVVMEPLRRVRAALRLWPPTRPLAALLEQVAAALVLVALRPDVVWCNTVLSACYVRPAILLRKRVVLHAHEPGERMAQVLARYRLGRYWARTALVGCAPRVCSDLARATTRRLEDVVYLPSVPERRRVHDLARHETQPLPSHGVLIGACGASNTGKGVDLWLSMIEQVAPAMADLDPHFVWIGGDPPVGFANRASSGPSGGRVTFTGSLDNPYPLLAALDVFTLPSRSDAFPLVVLEAMNLARPVVAFAVGDVAEQVGDAGRLVAPLDTARFAGEVVALLRDPAERERLGLAGQARAQAHFSSEMFVTGVRGIVWDLLLHGPGGDAGWAGEGPRRPVTTEPLTGAQNTSTSPAVRSQRASGGRPGTARARQVSSGPPPGTGAQPEGRLPTASRWSAFDATRILRTSFAARRRSPPGTSTSHTTASRAGPRRRSRKKATPSPTEGPASTTR